MIEIENESYNSEAQQRYFIDMNWYQEQGRSFMALAASRLCPASQKKKMPRSEAALLKTIKQCCSKWEGFATPNMPLLEMIFRLFLANDNQPLTLEQIQEKLQYKFSDSDGPRDLSIYKLKRIIEHDNYYGLKPLPQEYTEELSISPQSG